MSGAVPRELVNRDVVVAELGVLRTLLRDGSGGGAVGAGGAVGPAARRVLVARRPPPRGRRLRLRGPGWPGRARWTSWPAALA